MNRIINKYNVVAFYTEILEDQEEAPLLSGHRMLPPWQIEFNTTQVSGGVTATIVDQNLNAVQAIPGAAVASNATDDGKTYVTYRATTDLSPVLDEGIYRVKLVTDDSGTAYYSHPICVSKAFQEMEFQILPGSCTSASGGGYTFPLVVFAKATGMEANFELNYGNGYTFLSSETSATVDSNNYIGSGAVEIGIRRNVFYPDGSLVYKEYTLSTNTSGCAGSSLSTPVFGGRGYDNYCYLEFYNSNDMSQLGLFYQGNYKQKVYFHAAYDFPQPVIEDNFLTNGQNVPTLEKAAISEQIQFDAHGIPDYMLTVLQSVRAHDTVTLVTCADEKRMTLINFQVTPRTADNDNKSIVRITGEINRVFVDGCQTDKTTV